MDGISKVALIKCDNRVDAARRVIELIGLPDMKGKSVFVKPNYNSADPPPGCTHIETLRYTVEAISSMNPKSITVGDRSGIGNTRKVMETRGVYKLAEELGFKAIVLDELADDEWRHFSFDGMHWRRGFYFAEPPLQADSVVSLCCLKTHQFGGHFTMSLKNSVGMVRGKNMRELHTSIKNQRRMIAEVNKAYSPDFIIMDGVLAFTHRGPHKGEKWEAGLTFASNDRVALDVAGVAALKMHGTTRNIEKRGVFEQEQIQRAVELGLGASTASKIEILSDNQDGEEMAAGLMEIIEK